MEREELIDGEHRGRRIENKNKKDYGGWWPAAECRLFSAATSLPPLPTQEVPAHNCKKYVEATRALILGLFGFLNRAAYRLFKQEKNLKFMIDSYKNIRKHINGEFKMNYL